MTDQQEQTQDLNTLGTFVRDFGMKKGILSADIIKLKQALYETEFYQAILKKEQELRDIEKLEEETKAKIVNHMINFEIKSVDFIHQKFTLKTTPGSIKIADEKLVPIEFKKEKTEIVIDKKALKDAVQNGLVVEGVEIMKTNSLVITAR